MELGPIFDDALADRVEILNFAIAIVCEQLAESGNVLVLLHSFVITVGPELEQDLVVCSNLPSGTSATLPFQGRCSFFVMDSHDNKGGFCLAAFFLEAVESHMSTYPQLACSQSAGTDTRCLWGRLLR